VAQLPTLSRRQQRRIDREIREHFARHPSEFPPGLREQVYMFVMGWQPQDDDDVELFRAQFSGVMDAAINWAYERGKDSAGLKAND
jgi:hypothetical protein